MAPARKPTMWRRIVVEWEQQHKYLTWYVAIVSTVIVFLVFSERVT